MAWSIPRWRRHVGPVAAAARRGAGVRRAGHGRSGGRGRYRAVLQHSLHLTFWAVFVVSLLTVVLALLVPSVALGRLKEVPAE